METRSRSDLVGCCSRLQSTLGKWRETTSTIEEQWNDATAKAFYTQSLGEIEPVLTRMIATLQESVEMVQSIEKRVFDPGLYE